MPLATTIVGGNNRVAPDYYTATGNPTTADDVAAGYSLFDQILNTTTGARFVCVDNTASAAVWKQIIDGGVQTDTIGASTAAAGSTTTDAGLLPAGTAQTYPTTAADGTKGVRISASDKVTGRTIFVGNGVAAQTLKIYPPTGGTINGAAADAAYVTASGKGALLKCLSSAGNTWLALG